MEIETKRRALAVERHEADVELGVSTADERRLCAERDSLRSMIGAAPETLSATADYGTIVRVAALWETIRATEGRAVELEAEATIRASDDASRRRRALAGEEPCRVRGERAEVLPQSMRFGVGPKDSERDVFRISPRRRRAVR
jgi:hypothetical protein